MARARHRLRPGGGGGFLRDGEEIQTDCYHCLISQMTQKLVGAGLLEIEAGVAQLMQVAAEMTESLEPAERGRMALLAHAHFESCRADARKGFDDGDGVGIPKGHA